MRPARLPLPPPGLATTPAAPTLVSRGPRSTDPVPAPDHPAPGHPSAAPAASSAAHSATLSPAPPREPLATLPAPAATPQPPARPPDAAARTTPPPHAARQSRIHIGRIEVQLNNPAPPILPPAPAAPLAPLGSLETSFLGRFPLRV
ncbi:MAG TPA: hypothetical protein VGD62_01575 [Acidobacteriaceae bacterium]